jgi:hypothetical protein
MIALLSLKLREMVPSTSAISAQVSNACTSVRPLCASKHHHDSAKLYSCTTSDNLEPLNLLNITLLFKSDKAVLDTFYILISIYFHWLSSIPVFKGEILQYEFHSYSCVHLSIT